MNALAHAKGTLLIILAFVGSVGTVRAGTTYYVDGDGGADFRTIQQAVDAAASGDTIVLDAGTYTGSGNWDVVLGGKVLTIRSVDPNNPTVVAGTVIDCRRTDAKGHRAFEVVDDTGIQLNLAGLTIINSSNIFSGGAVLCDGADLDAINCVFSNHHVEWWGGAVYCNDSQATFRGCTFSGGASDALSGGGACLKSSVASFANCTFEANSGSAVVSYDSILTFTDCAFENNVGQDGGAVYSYITLDDVSLPLNMTRCTFVQNQAYGCGGAFWGFNVQGTMSSCTFMANTAGDSGGALHHHRSSPSITNCIFASNIAANIGGAIANTYLSSPTIVNSTLVSNEATGGGAIANKRESNALVSHSILWDNVAAQGKNLYLMRLDTAVVYFTKATIKYSDVENGPSSVAVDPGCTLTWGNGNMNADPLFTGPVQNDYHLSTDSPCIDVGSADYVPDVGAKDLDGSARLYGAAVDMGAYEFQGLGPVYRFWSPVKSKHFYTISGAERDSVLKGYSHIYQYEGVAYYAYYRPTEKDLVPVYRFWSPTLEAHFWTIDEQERSHIIKNLADIWVYEGVVFYAYPSGKQPFGTLPIYRFWSGRLAHHFYTMDEAEKEALIVNSPTVWTYEGIAWYAFAKPFQPKQATYDFTGGADDLWYAMTLSAYVDGKEASVDVPEVQLVPTFGRMQMTIDFTNLTTTFNTLYVQTETVQHAATITTQSGAVTIPLALSVEGSFAALTQRGPFDIDPATYVFADFAKANQNLTAKQATYTYSGSAVLGSVRVNFARASSALQFELQSFGAFEDLTLLPDAINARMPLTFQWNRPYVKDLLAEALVDGHLVQVYVTYVYVGTQGVWEGQAVR